MTRSYCQRPGACVAGRRGICPLCSAAANAARRERIAQARRGNLPIPGWVRRADLVEDFVDTAALRGEFAAAQHCRRLLQEARD